MGLAMAPTFPSVYNYASGYLAVTARISAVFVICSAFGEMVMPALVGWFFSLPQLGGYRALLPTIAIASLIGVLAMGATLLLLRGVEPLRSEAPGSKLSLDQDYSGLATEEDFTLDEKEWL